MRLAERSILVTGATGFIGGRVCERLIQDGATRVRALVHNVQHAARIARLPIELCPGDLMDKASLDRALDGMEFVVHLGLGHGAVVWRGTRRLLEAARSVKVNRIVHISSAAVYGLKPPADCGTDGTLPRSTGNAYCDGKLKAERVVARFGRRGMPVVTLRPSIVCGPYSRWSTRLVERLRAGKGVLIDSGAGVCNTIQVDNLVDAIYRSLDAAGAEGQEFFVTDGEKVTWGDFIRAHAAMIHPRPPLAELSSDEILAAWRQRGGRWRRSLREAGRTLVSPEFRDLIKRVPVGDELVTWAWYKFQALPEESRNWWRSRLRGDGQRALISEAPDIPDAETWAIQTNSVEFSIERARRVLGYEPRISFARGMELTEEWLRFANYL